MHVVNMLTLTLLQLQRTEPLNITTEHLPRGTTYGKGGIGYSAMDSLGDHLSCDMCTMNKSLTLLFNNVNGGMYKILELEVSFILGVYSSQVEGDILQGRNTLS